VSDHGFSHRYPQPPDAIDGEGHAQTRLRYEDIAQDGRVMITTIPAGLGDALWRTQLATHPLRESLRAEGIIPILSRLVIEATPGPFAMDPPLESHGRFALAHSRDARGEVERIHLNMWVDLTGARGRVWDPQPEGAGEPILAGRVFAEHVLTRLFAAPDQRKVRRVDALGSNGVPALRYEPRPFARILELPAGARPLDDALRIEPPAHHFGLMHTDSNQHVNSLVYPRIFEDCLNRRLASHGVTRPVLARALEIGFRKPCFAGERVHVALQAYELDHAFGAVGVFVAADDSADDASIARARPHAYVWARAEP
jgi:hypothetical protein